jgi:hypothetical protein
MLMERIIGAFSFKREVYADVEHDSSFTNTAWAIVAVVALIIQIPAYFASESIGAWLLGAVVSILFTLLGFAIGSYVIAWLGKTLFSAEVSYEEMVRALGLAYVWNVTQVFGGFLPLLCIGGILGLVSWFIAAREALDLDTGQTLLTVIAGWVVVFLVTAAAGFVLALFGLGASAITGALGS